MSDFNFYFFSPVGQRTDHGLGKYRDWWSEMTRYFAKEIQHAGTIDQGFLNKCNESFVNASPFPHIVIDDFWDNSLLETIASEVSANASWDGEKTFFGAEKKRYLTDWTKLPPETQRFFSFLNSSQFLPVLETITSEYQLLPDPYLEGGGIHSVGNGGFLKMHVDFNWHEKLAVHRRINLLIYLNEEWEESYRGDLILASMDENNNLLPGRAVPPKFNTTVIFVTDETSFHGHPVPLEIPDGRRRNSLAAYYYQASRANQQGSGRKQTLYVK